MTMPYPPPMDALDILYLDHDLPPEKAIHLLQRKINEVSCLVKAYTQFQEPLTKYISEVQNQHLEEMRTAGNTIEDLMDTLKFVVRKFDENTEKLTKLERMVNQSVHQSSLVREKQPLSFSLAEDLKPKPKIQVKMIDLPSWPTIESDDRSIPEPQSGQGVTNSRAPEGAWTDALKVQIEETTGALRDLINSVNNSDEPIKDGKIRHGCFEALATNCCMASNWGGYRAKNNLGKQYDLAEKLRMTVYSHGRKADDKLSVVEAACRAKGLMDGSRASAARAPQNISDRTSLGPSDLTHKMREIPKESLDDPCNIYTFTLSPSVLDPESIGNLTREQAVDIIKSLPLKVSFTTPVTAVTLHDIGKAQWAVKQHAQSDNTTNMVTLLRKRDSAPEAGGVSTATNVGPSEATDLKGKGRMHPSTFVPTAQGPSEMSSSNPQSVTPPPTTATTTDKEDREAARLARATRKRTPREDAEPTDGGEVSGEDEALPSEEVKPKAKRGKKAKATADAAEEESPAPTKPSKKRGAKGTEDPDMRAGEGSAPPQRSRKRDRSSVDDSNAGPEEADSVPQRASNRRKKETKDKKARNEEEGSPIATRPVKKRSKKNAEEAELTAAEEAGAPERRPVKKRKLRN